MANTCPHKHFHKTYNGGFEDDWKCGDCGRTFFSRDEIMAEQAELENPQQNEKPDAQEK